jgi:hypothetical protein
VLPATPLSAMGKVSTFAAGLFFATVGMAAAAHADAKQDQDFYRLLTEPDQDRPMVIWNFVEVRSEGIAVCRREDAGAPPYESMKELERPNGPYAFDDANNIASSAETIYCPWHGPPAHSEDPSWINVSAPVNPIPDYPPIAWYPTPPPYYPPGGGQGY